MIHSSQKPLFHRILVLALVLAATSCGKKTPESKSISVKNEAEYYLNHRRYPEAIQLLEDELGNASSGQEQNNIRILLASAYVGAAGVDVLSMVERFKDVIGDQSILGAKKKTQDDSVSKDEKLDDDYFSPADQIDPNQASLSKEAIEHRKAEEWIEKSSLFLTEVLDSLRVLEKFPNLKKTEWPYLDRALELLDMKDPPKDIRLYRIFIRLVYLKAVLQRTILRDDLVHARRWLCHVEVEKTSKRLSWALANVNQSLDDFLLVYPNKTPSFHRLKAAVGGFLDLFQALGGEKGPELSEASSRLWQGVYKILDCRKN